jgi:hypothetical protein
MNFFDTARNLEEASAQHSNTHELSTAAHAMTHSLMSGTPTAKQHIEAAKAHEKAHKAHMAALQKKRMDHIHAPIHMQHATLHNTMRSYHHIAADDAGYQHDWKPISY